MNYKFIWKKKLCKIKIKFIKEEILKIKSPEKIELGLRHMTLQKSSITEIFGKNFLFFSIIMYTQKINLFKDLFCLVQKNIFRF